MRVVRVGWAVLLLAAGCTCQVTTGGGSGGGGGSTTSTGGSGGTGGTGGSVGTTGGGQGQVQLTTYTVRTGFTYHWLTGTKDIADTTPLRFASYANGVNTDITGTRVDDFTITFKAPTSAFNYLQDGTFTYLDPPTTIDMRVDLSGRPGSSKGDAGTLLSIELSNLSPYDPDAALEFFEPNSGAYNALVRLWDAGVTAGTFRLDGAGARLIDTEQGDEPLVTQFIHGQLATPALDGGAPGWPVFDLQLLVNVANPSTVRMQSGVTTSAVASMAVATTLSAQLEIDTDGFAALRATSPTAFVEVDEAVYLSGTMFGSGVLVGATPDAVIAQTTMTDVRGYNSGMNLTFGWPFRNNTTPYTLVETCFNTWTDSTGKQTVRACAHSRHELARLSVMLAPSLSGPSSLTIDGQAPSNGTVLKSLTPTLAWRAPTLGTPSYYSVRVFELTTGQAKRVASYRTRGTSMSIFTSVLVSGRRYQFVVSAERGDPKVVYRDLLEFDDAPTVTPVLVAP